MSSEERDKWNAIHTSRGFHPAQPSRLVTGCAEFLSPIPRGRRALDVASGTGRHALWLAERFGFEVTIADISEAALAIASEEAGRRGIALTPVCIDLECSSFPEGPWELIVCFHYLQRTLIPRFATYLSPGGVLILVHPTVRNLERHPKPGRRYLAEEGELMSLALAANLEVLSHEEGWLSEERHETVLVCRRPAK